MPKKHIFFRSKIHLSKIFYAVVDFPGQWPSYHFQRVTSFIPFSGRSNNIVSNCNRFWQWLKIKWNRVPVTSCLMRWPCSTKMVKSYKSFAIHQLVNLTAQEISILIESECYYHASLTATQLRWQKLCHRNTDTCFTSTIQSTNVWKKKLYINEMRIVIWATWSRNSDVYKYLCLRIVWEIASDYYTYTVARAHDDWLSQYSQLSTEYRRCNTQN